MADNERDTERDRDYGTAKRSDGLARTLATIALILALLALGWAAKADKKAHDAVDKANNVINNLTH